MSKVLDDVLKEMTYDSYHDYYFIRRGLGTINMVTYNFLNEDELLWWNGIYYTEITFEEFKVLEFLLDKRWK